MGKIKKIEVATQVIVLLVDSKGCNSKNNINTYDSIR